MAPSKVLVVSSIALLVGVVLGSLLPFSWEFLFSLFLVWVVALLLASKMASRRIFLFSLAILFLLLGFLRTAFSFLEPPLDTPLIFQSFREVLAGRVGDVIGGQEQAIFSAMVLGDKTGLSLPTQEAFNRSGTRHILAISGLHLAIVASLIYQVLIGIGFWRRRAFWLALMGIIFFVFLVGSPPSAVRAGIMASLYLLANHVGRVAQSWRLLLFAATLMVLVSPHLLLFGIGFQLSFLAVLGIIFFKGFFDNLFSFVPWEYLRSLFSLSFAAQLTTWPIIAKSFGTISLIGFIANLIAVPLLPVIMMLGIGFVVLGWPSTFLAKVFLWPAWVLLHFISIFISWLSGFVYASVELGSISLLIILLYYGLLIVFYNWLKKNDVKLSTI